MNKEIEEMYNEIEKLAYDNYIDTQEINMSFIQALYNAGYRKTVWHKVADGDLPKENGTVYVYYKTGADITAYAQDYYSDGKFLGCGKQVIAWTELPKYEGEK